TVAGDPAHAQGLLGGGYAAAGRTEDAKRVLAALRERARSEYVAPLHMSFTEVALGDLDATFDSLGRACKDRNALAWWWIMSEPNFDAVRRDGRFPALAARVEPD